MHHCLTAAETLAQEGIDAEVIDLRSLKPLDEAHPRLGGKDRTPGGGPRSRRPGRAGAKSPPWREKGLARLRAPVSAWAVRMPPAAASYPPGAGLRAFGRGHRGGSAPALCT